MRRLMILGVCSFLFLTLPSSSAAQDAGSDAGSATESGFELQQNYPNPFNTTTRIPFRLAPDLFGDGDGVAVTMRIFNVLQQLVAYPTARNHPSGSVPVRELTYDTPGPKEAFWDGRDTNGRAVASGIYYLQATVAGERRIMSMIVSR